MICSNLMGLDEIHEDVYVNSFPKKVEIIEIIASFFSPNGSKCKLFTHLATPLYMPRSLPKEYKLYYLHKYAHVYKHKTMMY